MSGYVLYILFAILFVVFWRVRAGRNYDQLLEAGDHDHHRIMKMLKAHPKGGSWADYKRWMAETS